MNADNSPEVQALNQEFERRTEQLVKKYGTPRKVPERESGELYRWFYEELKKIRNSKK